MKVAIDQIKAIFTERADLTEATVLEQLGYVPKLAEGTVVMQAAEAEALRVKGTEGVALTLVAQTERERIVSLSDICLVSGTPQLLGGFIKSKTSVEDAKAAILDAKKNGLTPILSTVGAVSDGAVNPLIANARERADRGK